MGKRTSDFVALATVLGGVGVGFGLTSLFARSAPVALVDDVSVHDVSVKVRIVPSRVLVRDGRVISTIYFRGRPGPKGPTWSPSGEVVYMQMQDFQFELQEEARRLELQVREIEGADRADLAMRLGQMAELQKEFEYEARELYEETLEELDCLEAAAQGDEDEDQRRRRRRRRPCR